MKTFTKIIYKTDSLIKLAFLFLLTLYFAPTTAIAQTVDRGERNCNYQSTDGCFAIGYVSVSQSPTGPGNSQNNQNSKNLDVEIFYQDICGVISEIKINRPGGQPIIIPQSQITRFQQTTVFQVNSNAFNNKGEIKITIEFSKKSKEKVDIIFSQALNCGIIDPLAVELTSFKGMATQSGINLNWETASEENNSHFEVERSADGDAYQHVASVQGVGNSNIKQEYVYIDSNPILGVNYYRLKQVDFDGTASYSKTIAVQNSIANEMQVVVAPNPCRNGDCEILLRGLKGARQTLLELKDMSGKVVLSKVVRDGAARLSPEEVRNHKGLFILSATSGNEVVHQRVILE